MPYTHSMPADKSSRRETTKQRYVDSLVKKLGADPKKAEEAFEKWYENWKDGVTDKRDDFCSGVAGFVGVKSCNERRADNYDNGIKQFQEWYEKHER